MVNVPSVFEPLKVHCIVIIFTVCKSFKIFVIFQMFSFFTDIVLALISFGVMIVVFIGYEIYARKKKLDKR